MIPGSRRSPAEGNGNPLQYSCLESPRDGGAWWAAIYGVAQSQTRLKRLSSSSSRAIAHQAFLFMGFPRQECWSELPFPSAGDLLDPGMEPTSLAWQVDSLPLAPHKTLCVLVAQLCLTLCDPMDCSPPGSNVLGIFQARILEWVAIPSSRASS